MSHQDVQFSKFRIQRESRWMNDNLIILTLENYWQLYIYVMCLLSTTFRECFTFTFELVSMVQTIKREIIREEGAEERN